MRVGILGLLQECNTFLDSLTTVERFREDTLLVGEPIREHFADAHHEVGGLFAGLNEAGVEAVPLFLARALPFGPITTEARQGLFTLMMTELEQAMPLDGVLAAFHGADVAVDVPDLDGQWLGEIRKRLGDGIPLIGTLDPHANLSRAMVENTDALLAYRTNPHTDQREIGRQAALLMARTLKGEVRPTQAACFPPLAINIERQLTSAEPLASHFRSADEMLSRPGVVSNSITLGFPYADVPEMGSAVVVVTDNDPELASTLAREMGRRLWNDRDRFVGEMIDIEMALAKAKSMSGRICLLDMGDNVGGGSPGDATLLLHALRTAEQGPAVVCLADAEAVRAATSAGVGARLELEVGGKGDHTGPPFRAMFTVSALEEGRFSETEPRHGGFSEFDQGPSAVLRCDPELTIVVTTRRMAPFSLGQLTCMGLDPTAFRILVAKGVQAPVAAYRTVCDHFIRVDTPGVTSANMSRLEYRNRRRPLFPLERDFEWSE